MSFQYNYEITENCPRASQPVKIKTELKMHQLACLHKAIQMENSGECSYMVNDNYADHSSLSEITVKSNVGILGDIVGYGKTLIGLSIIAANDTCNIHRNNEMHVSHCSNKNYNYISFTKKNKNTVDTNIINSTLIIVPRGPVYMQWKKALEKETKLKYLAIENLTFIKKNLPDTDEHATHPVSHLSNPFHDWPYQP